MKKACGRLRPGNMVYTGPTFNLNPRISYKCTASMPRRPSLPLAMLQADKLSTIILFLGFDCVSRSRQSSHCAAHSLRIVMEVLQPLSMSTPSCSSLITAAMPCFHLNLPQSPHCLCCKREALSGKGPLQVSLSHLAHKLYKEIALNSLNLVYKRGRHVT